MREKLLDKLACPSCRGEALSCEASERAGDDIRSGNLICTSCGASYPIRAGIPRFLPDDNYAASFGYQWNRFRVEQLDSYNGTNLSAERFFRETAWAPDELRGKWILDAGCGAGRFLDVASQTGAEVIGVDLSAAVDAAAESLAGRPNVHLIQASIFDLPLRRGVLEGAYCIGVIQHTPDPRAAMMALPGPVRAGGRVAVTIYERRPLTPLYSKYLWRRVTTRLPQSWVMRGIEAVMPVVFPVTERLFRAPLVGKLFRFTLPVANYVEETRLTREQRYAWALLDTFDMLAPRYDQPQTQAEAEDALRAGGLTALTRLPNPGVNLIGTVRSAP